jgi:hypothetical protein
MQKRKTTYKRIGGLNMLPMYKVGSYMVLEGLNLVKGNVAKQGCPLISYILSLLIFFAISISIYLQSVNPMPG